MKHFLLTIAMALSFSLATMAVPQKPTVADSATVDEVEVFSDTTSTDTVNNASADWDEWDDWDEATQVDAGSLVESLGFLSNTLSSMFFVICVLVILFILAPLAIIGIVLYFVYKNRKQRLRLAELALKNGKPMPFDVTGAPVGTYDALWNKGIKQMFLGAGLAILLWVILGKLGFAIGALVLLIGCGNMVIAYQDRQKRQKMEMYKHMFGNGSDKKETKVNDSSVNEMPETTV